MRPTTRGFHRLGEAPSGGRESATSCPTRGCSRSASSSSSQKDLGDPAALPAAVVAGGFAAIVALFALLVTETDEAFANVYSAAVSLQNVVPRAPQKLLLVLVTAIATAGALVIDLVSYQSFLLLLGSVFVPLFAVLLADWVASGHHLPDPRTSSRPPTGGLGSSPRG